MTARLALNILLASAIVACVAGAVALLFQDSRSPGGVTVTLPTPTSADAAQNSATMSGSASGEPARIAVYASGEVRRPGVYSLDSGARVADALRAAGGPTDGADLDAVNLAMRLSDGQQIHFPASKRVNGMASAVSNGVHYGGSSGNAYGGANGAGGKLNLNTATADELETLPGIGERKAAAIVEYRGANGPFQRVDDLVEVSGIGEGILGSIRDMVRVR